MNKRAFLSEKTFILLMLVAGIVGTAVILQGTGGITGYAVDEFEQQVNQPPVYIGGNLETAADTPLTIDLATLFSDPENDALTFLVTQEDQISAEVIGSVATFVPATGFVGERTVTVMVSDSVNLLRESVRLTVTGAAVPTEEPAETPIPNETVEPTPSEIPIANETNETITLPEVTPTPENVTNDTFAAEPVVAPEIPAGRSFGLNAEVRDDSNAKVGTKIADEPGYETYFTVIASQGPQFMAVFAHNANETLPVWIEGDVGASLSTAAAAPFENITLIVPLQLGRIPRFRLHVGAQSEIFDFGTEGGEEFGVSDVITSCGGEGVVVNTSTSLTADLIANESCIFINASNLFFNCSGFRITFGTAGQSNRSGIAVDTETNVTIKDCVILSGSLTNSRVSGINLTQTNDSFVLNNTIQLNGTTLNTGIRIWESGHRNTIANNTIDVRSNETLNFGISGGASITSSETMSNNSFIGNRITTNGTSGNTGVFFSQTIIQSILENNTIITTNGTGVNLAGTKLNTVSNNSINTTQGGIGIRITESLFIEATLNRVDNNTITTNGFSEDHGIQFVTNAIHNNITRNTVVTNSPGSHAIRINNDANQNNSFTFNNLSARGVLSYAVFAGHNSTFAHNILDNPVNWINVTAGVLTNFTNTTFLTAGGSIRVFPLVHINGSQDVTLQRLNVTQNRAFLDSVNLTFLNQSARVTLNNITFSNPRMLVDFDDDGLYAPCPTNICAARDLTGDTLSFNVSRFTSYSSEDGLRNLSACAVVNQSSVLTQNVTADGTCIFINNNSVQLDCNGFSITYGTNASRDNSLGVNVSTFNGSTIANCVIRKGSTGGNWSHGIGLFNAQFAHVANNTIITNGTTGNNGIHVEGSVGTSQTVELITGPGDPTHGGTPLTSNCVAQTNVNSCSVCPISPGIACSSYVEQSGCPDQNVLQSETFLNFTLQTGNLPKSGFVQIYGGEIIDCRLNGNFILGFGYARNQCGRRNAANIPGEAFVNGENVFRCTIRGGGKEVDSGMRVYKFSYILPGQRPSNLTIRNNTIVSSGGNSSYGMFLDLVNSTVANNTVTATGQFFAHGINVGFGGINNTFVNNTVRAFANGADGIHVNGILNTFINNTVINATRSAVFLESAINNTFNQTLIALSRSRSSLFIDEVHGSVNFTQQVNLTTSAFLGDVVSIGLNRTFLNSSHPAGGQLNRSAIVSLILNASFFDSVPVFDAADADAFQACRDPRCREINFSAGSGVLRFNVSSFTTYAAAEVSGCGVLDGDPNASTSTYTLVNNITATADCFEIIGDNVTLNCDGFTIYYGTNNINNVYGVDIRPANGTNETINETLNVAVRNCVIVQNGTGTGAHGIRVAQGRNVTLFNNNITTRGVGSNGVSVQISHNVSVGGVIEYGGASVASTNGVFANFSVGVSVDKLNVRQNGTGNNASAIVFFWSNFTGINGTNASTLGVNSSAFLYLNVNGILGSNANASTSGNLSPAISLLNVTNGRIAVVNASASGPRVSAVSATSTNNVSFVLAFFRTDGHAAPALFAVNSAGIGGAQINATTTGNESAGVLLTNSSHAALGISNITTFGTNADAILLANGTAVNLTGGTITTHGLNAHGVHLNELGNASLRSLHIAPSDDALRVDGEHLPHWNSHDIDTSNTGIGGGVIQYYGGAGSSPACPSGTTSIAAFYHVTLVNCGTALLTGFNSPEMITIIGTNGTSLSGATVTNASRGLRVFFSNFGTVANSTFSTANGVRNFGVHLRNASGINFSGSRVHTDGIDGTNYGLFLQNNSRSNNISLNNISTNGTEGGVGILMTTGSAFNAIHNNVISTRGTNGSNSGIALNFSAENNTISNNTISTNGTGSNIGIEIHTHGNLLTNNVIFATGSANNNIGVSVTTQGGTVQTFNDGFEDGTLSPFTSTGTNNVWVINSTTRYAGSFGASSGDINDSQSTTLTLTRTLASAGTISFARNVSSESGFDFLTFYIDGVSQAAISGSSGPMIYVNFSVAAGTHTFTWVYSKDLSASTGLDMAFVDEINITEGIVPEGNNVSQAAISTQGGANSYGIQYATGVSGTLANNVIRTRGTSVNNTGILVTSGTAVNITNNRIATFGTSNNNGMLLQGLTFSNILNNSVHTDGNSSYNRGIVFSTSSNNTLENNNITTNGTSNNNGLDLISSSNGNMLRNTTIVSAHGTAEGNKGIVINQSNYNKALLNNITANGSFDNIGIAIVGHSGTHGHNNTADFNVIRTGGNESNNKGILLYNFAADNNMSLNNITTNGTFENNGIRMDGNPDRNNASNNTIVTSGSGGSNHGVMIVTNFSDADYNVVERSLINTTGTELDVGVYLYGVFNGNRVRFSRIYANTIRSSGSGTRNYGIYLHQEAQSNIIQANAMNTTGSGNNTGIRVEGFVSAEGPDNNDIFTNTIQTGDSGSDNAGIVVSDAIGDSTIETVNISNNIIMTNGTNNNHGIAIIGFVSSVNATANRIVTNGSANNHGIVLNGTASSLSFAFTNITTNGSQSFAIRSNLTSSSASFRFMRFNATTEWINATATSTNSFENVTFEERNGSIQIYPAFTLSGRQEVTKQRLNISHNRAFLNSTNLTSMNRSAIIVLRNITFLDPVPAVDFNDDGASDVCGFPRCVELSFENEVFTFNVTNFSAYSAVGNVNVTLTKYDSPDPVGAGETLTYRIEVNITGNTTAFNVTVNDTYPGEVIFASASPSPNSGTNNTFSLGNLSNGTSFNINITVTPRSTLGNGTVLNNTVNITYQNESGQRPSLVTSELTTVYGPFNVTNISIAKTDAPDPAENGTRLNYTITLTFNGNGTAYNVTVIETYPADTVFNSAQPDPLTGTNNTFIIGNVSAGSTFVLNLSVNISQIANGTLINNTANVTFQNETGNRPSRIATASTTVQNVTIDTPPPPPPPAPSTGGGGGGWTTPTVGGVEQPAIIPDQDSDGCSESWTCDDWSSCVNGKQVRTCTDWGSCNTTLLLPLTERACVMPTPVVEPEEEPLMMPTLQPEAEPQLETPRWTLCTLLPIVVDGALIVLAVLVLLYLILTMRQKQDARMRTAVDIMLAVALLLLIAQYIVCDTFLPLEYLIFLLLTVFAVLLRVADYLSQKKVKPVITPRKPWSQSFRDVEHKLESLKPTLPKLEKPSWFALPKLPQRTSPQPKLKEKASLLKRIDASLTRAFTPKPKPQPNKLPKPVAPKLLPQPKAPKPAPLPQTKPLKKLFSFAPQPKAQVSAPEPRASTRDLKDILAAVHQSEKLLERYSRTTKRFKKK